MRRFFSTLTLLAGLFSGLVQAAPYYYFEHYTTYDGLPSNTIHCTYQDRFGFMWIGTRDGLVRFDGYDFRAIGDPGTDNPTNLASICISGDEDGLLWFSTSAGISSYDPFTGESRNYGMVGNLLCFSLAPDLKGNIWFTSDKLYRLNKETDTFSEYRFEGSNPTSVAVDSYDAVWVLLADGTLHLYDKLKDRFKKIPFNRTLTDLQPADDGRLLVATNDGDVLLIETISMATTLVFHAEGRDVRKILERKSGEYWIGTTNGLFVKRMDDPNVSAIYHDDREPQSLSASFVQSLSKDKIGNVWVGTYYAGLNVWQDKQDEFSLYYKNPSPRSMSGEVVRSIETDPDGFIWFCTEDGGLNRLPSDRVPGESFFVATDLNMQDLVIVGDHIWIHTFGEGVYLFDRKKHVVLKHYDVPQSSGIGLYTRSGRLFTGAMQGLYEFDPMQDRFVRHDPSFTDFVHSVYQDSRGNIWLGTYGTGLYCCDGNFNRIAHITSQDRTRGLTSDRITSFFEDSKQRIWITTEGGGICYTDPQPNISNLHLYSLTRSDGLTSNVTCAVAEDEDGRLWVSTTRGIVRINGNDLKVEDFLFDRHQIIGSQFSYGAVEKTPSGIIYMGNTKGLIGFSPAKMKKAVRYYPLYITEVLARNADRSQHLHEPGRSTIQSQNIRVRAKDASQLTISFAAPDYSILHQVAFTYSLKRGRRVISEATIPDNQVSFSGLPSGHYRFDVGILGSDTPTSQKSLEIDITPPALLSPVAQIIYLLLLLSLVAFGIYQLELKRQRDRARHLSKIESQKQKEIYDAKINFFTNITHEIRTPLSLIKMPLDKLIAEKEYTPKAEKDMLTIQANADRLLTLTNQLLDLRRMEKNQIRPVFIEEDLCEIVRQSCTHFEQMAKEQRINLTMNVPEQPFMVMCVRDSVEKILANLLSNGLKYTQDRIDVTLRPSPDGNIAVLRVDSNGTVIPSRDSEKIFEVFYQVDDSHKNKGTGLGLPFARSLAELHGGQLYLDTTIRNRNSFVLELPVRQQQTAVVLDQPQAPEPEAETEADNASDHDSSRHTLLIVEDSTEMRNYLARELADDYNIVTAVNGQDAVEKLQQERIDLVVSDIMMPVMDGCQLCNYVKTNMEYSHLPVLLLTAAVGMETRLQTLEVGADGYIEKPFPIELLRANIANLFKNREISYLQFTNSPLTHFNSVNTSKMDEEFMEKLHSIVMKHMAEQDLSIETLTTMIGTSKSTLYRKVKANTGLNINEYIRLCRLKQAAEMLSSQKYRINEVAYMVGFSSPSYFATSFQKQFNISPSAFVKNLKD